MRGLLCTHPRVRVCVRRLLSTAAMSSHAESFFERVFGMPEKDLVDDLAHNVRYTGTTLSGMSILRPLSLSVLPFASPTAAYCDPRARASAPLALPASPLEEPLLRLRAVLSAAARRPQ